MTPRHRLFGLFVMGFAALSGFVLGGCAPAGFEDGVAWTIRQYRATDARCRAVKGMPFLRVDDHEFDQLKSIAESCDASNSPAKLVEVLSRCNALSIASINNEIDRLPPRAIDELWQRYSRQEPGPKDPKEAIRDRYLQQLEIAFEPLRVQAAAARDHAEICRIAKSIRDNVGPSVKDQHGGGPLLQVVQSKYERDQGAGRIIAGPFDVYSPAVTAEFPRTGNSLSPEEKSALIRHAPNLFQERHANADYPARSDEIGTVMLSGSPDRIVVNIETTRPKLYAYARRAMVHNREHLQLVYCWWFPEHPAMTPNDPEAGRVDGATICITLDSRGKPAIVEAIQNCGCHIHCFVSSDLEASAKLEWKNGASAAGTALEKPEDRKPRLTISGLFDLTDMGETARLAVISRAGFHDVVAVEGGSFDLRSGRTVLSKRTYDLAPYDSLENLPTSFGRASMFGPDGLVHNAGRLEGWLLAPTGMRSAGQPRQRGTQMVCWDALDFDDPHLLEKTLRLPSDF